MPLNLQKKQEIVKTVNKVAQNAMSAILADFRGIKVSEITELRKLVRNVGVYMRVIRNTLLCRIVTGTNFECLRDVFTGPTLIAFSIEHPGTAARIFRSFSKENTTFKIKAAAFNGAVILDNDIDFLANLPTYEEAIIRLMLVIKDASSGKLVRTFAALRDKKTFAD